MHPATLTQNRAGGIVRVKHYLMWLELMELRLLMMTMMVMMMMMIMMMMMMVLCATSRRLSVSLSVVCTVCMYFLAARPVLSHR